MRIRLVGQRRTTMQSCRPRAICRLFQTSAASLASPLPCASHAVLALTLLCFNNISYFSFYNCSQLVVWLSLVSLAVIRHSGMNSDIDANLRIFTENHNLRFSPIDPPILTDLSIAPKMACGFSNHKPTDQKSGWKKAPKLDWRVFEDEVTCRHSQGT